MNRHAGLAEADATARLFPETAEPIRQALFYLANIAGPTATGSTLFLPEGTTLFLSVEDARALYRAAKDGVTS